MSKLDKNDCKVVAQELITDDDVKKEQDAEAKSASFAQLFSTADSFDYLLMLVGSFGACITGLSMPFFNVLFGDMVDTLNTDADAFANEVERIAMSFVIVAGVQIVSCTLQVGCWTLSGERQTQKIREKYVQSILSQEIGWFDQCGASTLATRVADNTGKLKDGITRKAGDLIQFAAQFIGSFGVGFYLNWKLTCVLLASFPLIAGAGLFMINAITAAQNNSGENYAQAGGLASEALNSIRTVSAYNTQPKIIQRYRAFLFDAMNIGIVKGFKVGFGNGLVFSCCFLTYALGFWYGGKLIADGMDNDCGLTPDSEECVTGGNIIATFFSVIIGSFSLGQVAPPLSSFFAAKAAVYPMIEVIERVPLIDQFSSQGDSPKERPAGKLELKDIVFAYPSRPEIDVCKGYSLDINPGEVVALVGPSGSGKSTIINLLLRFYDPSSGSLLLDGQDIKSLNVRWLRSQIGYVGQEPVLFKGSVEENIAFGLGNNITNAGINDEAAFDGEIKKKIIAAAKLANAHDFISEFPDGYATDIGSAGIAVSGGQKQRIAIARALIKKPAVLLLDEATSALDTASERMVQDSIAELQKSKQQTTIVIAHRLSTIRNADKIAVINEGKIVELGTHDELVALNGRYADLIRLQVADETAPEFSSDASNNDTIVKVEKKVVADIKEDNKVEDKILEKTDSDRDVKDESMSKVWSLVYGHKGWLAMALIGGALFGCVFPFWGLLLSMSFDMFYQPTSGKIL
jgi:ATP-binding cassette subfamily B (MDR/TAP) protein 1